MIKRGWKEEKENRLPLLFAQGKSNFYLSNHPILTPPDKCRNIKVNLYRGGGTGLEKSKSVALARSVTICCHDVYI
jgi:hypothetical protein